MKLFILLILSFSLTFAIMPSKYASSDSLLDEIEDLEDVPVDNTRWAFIIAVEDYEYTEDVDYSENSGEAFELLAQKRLGISERHTYSLINERATTSRILDSLDKLLANVKKGDTIFFYYSGHGVPVPEENNEPYILPVDKSINNLSKYKELKLSNIYKKLSNSKAEHVVAFVDSCFSGATDENSVFIGVAAPRLRAKNVEVNKNKMSVITAGGDKQFSNMYKDKKHRLFSYYLMEGIAVKNYTDIETLFNYVRHNVATTSEDFGTLYKQVPTVNGNTNLKF